MQFINLTMHVCSNGYISDGNMVKVESKPATRGLGSTSVWLH